MKKTLKWVSGIILLMGAITPLTFGGIGIPAGILLIIGGLFCLPPTCSLIEKQLKTTLKTPIKYVIVIFCVATGSVIMSKDKRISNSINNTKDNNKIDEKITETKKPFNKDSIIARMKKDEVYTAKHVELDKDSVLHVYLKDYTLSDQAGVYYDTTYKLLESGLIQEIEIDKGKKMVNTYGLKTAAAIKIFKDNVMVGNKKCFVLEETIKKSLNDESSYDFVDGGYSYEGNDLFSVWLVFTAKNGFNATIKNKAVGEVTKNGVLLSYKLVN